MNGLSVLRWVVAALASAATAGHAHEPVGPVDRALEAVNTDKSPDWSRINALLFAHPARDLRSAAARAYVWGMPLIHAATIRDRFVQGDGVRPGSLLNRFAHSRMLAGPDTRLGVGLNNDTIYSLAWVDLSEGPLVLTAPDFGTRYYTFSMNFADTSATQSLGRRTHGGQLPPVFIHGPGFTGQLPKAMVIVASKTRYLNIAGRILVRSPDEYPTVHALQDRIGLTRWRDWSRGIRNPAPPPTELVARLPQAGLPDGQRFLVGLSTILQQWTVDPTDRPLLRSLRILHLAPGQMFDPTRFTPAQRAEIEEGVAIGRRLVLARSLQLGVQVNGWTINYGGPRFGQDFLLRAGVAKDQPNVAIPEEALYPLARVDAAGTPLSAAHGYRLRFAPGALPPVRAFWSVTVYDDRGAMVPNEVARYSLGDRTPGLIRDADGGITLHLYANRPSSVTQQNWLPLPRNGPFYLMLRLYEPERAALERRWLPPPIERVD